MNHYKCHRAPFAAFLVMHSRSDSLGEHNAALARQGEMLADLGLSLACHLHHLLQRLPGFSKQVEQLECVGPGSA